MEARVFKDIIIIGHIQNLVQEFLQLEEFHAVAIISQLYNLFPGNQKSKKQFIIIYMVEYIIVSILKL